MSDGGPIGLLNEHTTDYLQSSLPLPGIPCGQSSVMVEGVGWIDPTRPLADKEVSKTPISFRKAATPFFRHDSGGLLHVKQAEDQTDTREVTKKASDDLNDLDLTVTERKQVRDGTPCMGKMTALIGQHQQMCSSRAPSHTENSQPFQKLISKFSVSALLVLLACAGLVSLIPLASDRAHDHMRYAARSELGSIQPDSPYIRTEGGASDKASIRRGLLVVSHGEGQSVHLASVAIQNGCHSHDRFGRVLDITPSTWAQSMRCGEVLREQFRSGLIEAIERSNAPVAGAGSPFLVGPDSPRTAAASFQADFIATPSGASKVPTEESAATKSDSGKPTDAITAPTSGTVGGWPWHLARINAITSAAHQNSIKSLKARWGETTELTEHAGQNDSATLHERSERAPAILAIVDGETDVSIPSVRKMALPVVDLTPSLPAGQQPIRRGAHPTLPSPPPRLDTPAKSQTEKPIGMGETGGAPGVTHALSHAHGTAVASVAAGVIDAMGYSDRVRILPIKVFDAHTPATIGRLVRAIHLAADGGARVVNASFGEVQASNSLMAAASYLATKGGILVTAAGNEGRPGPWSRAEHLITVSATDEKNRRARWSNYGPYIDLAAPGQGILATVPGGQAVIMNGSSFAAPQVAAAAIMAAAFNPKASPQELRASLTSTAQDLGRPGVDDDFGHGLINVAFAVSTSAAWSEQRRPAASSAGGRLNASSPSSGQSQVSR